MTHFPDGSEISLLRIIKILRDSHVPLLIGVFAAIQGSVASYHYLAAGGGTPDPLRLAEAISQIYVAPLCGMLLMVPGYATAALAAFVRCLAASAEGQKNVA